MDRVIVLRRFASIPKMDMSDVSAAEKNTYLVIGFRIDFLTRSFVPHAAFRACIEAPSLDSNFALAIEYWENL